MNFLDERIVDEIVSQVEWDKSFWIAKNVQVDTLIQNGPQCGIVALCMALNYMKVNCTIDELMEKARKLNFTKKGEIFDVNFLYELAKSEVNAKMLDLNEDKDFFEILLTSKLILFPYDCDFNHAPCNKKGIKAHWALITGFILPIDHDESISLTFGNYSEEKRPCGIEFIDSVKPEQIAKLKENYENKYYEAKRFSDLVYVVSKQGKSKHLGVWRLKYLLESNRQLKDIDYKKCDPSEFVLPLDGDLSKSLSKRFLVIS